MPPGSKFDTQLKIDAGQVTPRGPLARDPGETVKKLYAWVFQLKSDGTGAACMATQDDPEKLAGANWTTRPDAINEGSFQEGAAIGMAVTISTDAVTEKTKVYWWSETLYVKP
jgi:hypothetical protein